MELIFRQLFEHESKSFTYLLADAKSGEAIIIDPVFETSERDLKLIRELGLRLLYILDTHVHADHISASAQLRKMTGAKTGIGKASGVEAADLYLTDGDKVPFGSFELHVLSTPGHTDHHLAYQVADMIFTGDTLFFRGTGRTDFQGGSASALYESVHNKIFALPPQTRIYPGHDYNGHCMTSVWEEQRFNPRLGGGKTKEEFIQIMSNLNLSNPKKMNEAVPANLKGGLLRN